MKSFEQCILGACRASDLRNSFQRAAPMTLCVRTADLASSVRLGVQLSANNWQRMHCVDSTDNIFSSSQFDRYLKPTLHRLTVIIPPTSAKPTPRTSDLTSSPAPSLRLPIRHVVGRRRSADSTGLADCRPRRRRLDALAQVWARDRQLLCRYVYISAVQRHEPTKCGVRLPFPSVTLRSSLFFSDASIRSLTQTARLTPQSPLLHAR